MTTTDLTRKAHHALVNLDHDALRCPHVQYALMRDEGPLHEVPELGFSMVTRYEAILDIVRDPETFSSAMPTGPQVMQAMMTGLQEALAQEPAMQEIMASAGQTMGQPVLLNADPPVHNRQRGLVNRAFSSRRVGAMEAHIREVADALVDEFVEDGHVELVRQFAVGLPLIVIAEALGVPKEELATFKRWSDDFVVAIGNHTLSTSRLIEMMKSQAEFGLYFAEKIEQRRADPRDDLISDVVQASHDGEELSTGEMLGMFSQFLVAGNETTTKLITSAVTLLLDNPDQLALVQGNRSLVANLVEEALRLESPVQGLFRTATRDTEVAGVPVKAGTALMCVYASGNRDATTFPEPDRLDVTRPNSKMHLAFSQGPHYCIGASLARAEGRIALEVLLERLADLRCSPTNTFEYEESYILHGTKELHLEFTPGPRLG